MAGLWTAVLALACALPASAFSLVPHTVGAPVLRRSALATSPRPRLQLRIIQHFVRLNGKERPRQNAQNKDQPLHSAGTPCAFVRRAPAATRYRLSDNDNAPPSAIRMAPPQIQLASGL